MSVFVTGVGELTTDDGSALAGAALVLDGQHELLGDVGPLLSEELWA